MSDVSIDRTQLPIARSGVHASYLIRAWHRVQERVRDPRRRVALARLMASFRPRAPALESGSSSAEHAALVRDGVAFFPRFISRETADQLRELLTQFECQDPWRPTLGNFRLENAPPDTHVADIPAAPTLNALQALALDPRLVNLAANYFGCKPYLDSIQAWWSLAGNESPQEAENFHRDNDSIRFVKFFLYLTDVDRDSGPHKFVVGSHREARLLERRRHTDQEVETEFGAGRILEIGGSAGDAFMEDTFGLHKGQLPRSRIRLLAQFRYSMTPTIFRSPIVVASRLRLAGITSLLHDS
jgi:hypothetical protein